MEDYKILIKKFQESSDYSAKTQLLEEYYFLGCKWAQKHLSKIVYTNFINPSKEEVQSLVYQAFEKALSYININDPEDNNTLSFKNFFFLMIKYQIYSELKQMLNYMVIPDFDKEKHNLEKTTRREIATSERNHIKNLDNNLKVEQILDFLKTKNFIYAQIISLKIAGHKNPEICNLLKINPISLKSNLQYIKRLLREKFSNTYEIS